MDPNETLNTIRREIKLFDRAKNNDSRAVHGALLADAVDALDTWISSGGFRPSAWDQK